MFVTRGGAIPRSPREAVVADRTPASNGSRVGYLVDVAMVLTAVAALLAAGLVVGLEVSLAVCVVAPAASWISSALVRANVIRTPAQVLARITITTGQSGHPIGFWRHLTRTAVFHLSSVLLFAGAMSVLIGRGRPSRGCHEKISDTNTAGSVGSAETGVVRTISTGPDVRSVLDTGESVTAIRSAHLYEVGTGTVVNRGQRSSEVAR